MLEGEFSNQGKKESQGSRPGAREPGGKMEGEGEGYNGGSRERSRVCVCVCVSLYKFRFINMGLGREAEMGGEPYNVSTF